MPESSVVMNHLEHTGTNALRIDLTKIPPLLDCDGVRKNLAPISRTTLYELATLGEIQSASLGLGRGRRVFVTASIVAWLERRMAQTKQPNLAPRADRSSSAEVASL